MEKETEFIWDKLNRDKVIIRTTYRFRADQFVIDKLPSSCYSCPSGFSGIPGHPCGRNVPFLPEDRERRPPTCKLRSLEQYFMEEALRAIKVD